MTRNGVPPRRDRITDELHAQLAEALRAKAELEAQLQVCRQELSQSVENLSAERDQRRLAEETCRESEGSYRWMFEASVDAILLTTPEGGVLAANPAASRLFGCTEGDLQGLGRAGVVDATDPRLPAALEERARTGQFSGELTLIRKDGTRFPGEVSSVLFGTQGGPVRACMIIRDTTRVRQAEEALRHSETRFRTLFMEMMNGCALHEIVCDDAGQAVDYVTLEVNRAYETLLNNRREDVIGKKASEILPPGELRKWLGIFGPVALTGESTRYEMYSPFNGKHFEGVAYCPVRGRFAVTFGDVTERTQAEDRIRQANAELEQRIVQRTAELRTANAELVQAGRLKDEFMANMSHELRTPLATVLGLCETLQMGIAGPLSDKQAQMVQAIRQSGQHLLGVITDILDLSKIEAGRVEPDFAPTAVSDACEVSLQFVRQAAQKKNIRVTYVPDPQLGVMLVDGRLLKQMLVNLLSNAVKFTPAGGQVGLEVAGRTAEADTTGRRVAGREVCFTVWDTGIGIPSDKLPLLFQPFMQVDGSLSRRYEGTGLGLALTRRLAELHGGRVTAASEGAGKGSRFTLVLPWRAVEAAPSLPEAAGPAEPAPAPPADRRPVILVADDNEASRMAVGGFLETLPATVVVARDGQEALDRAREAPPDIILMDIQMPGVDGLEAIRQLRAAPATARTPVIALTALAMPGDRERCLAAGADAYVGKPAGLEELGRLVRGLLTTARAD